LPRTTEDTHIPGIQRLLALTDGVVAIALTLLVLQLQVPVTHALEHNPDSATNLWHALDVDGAEITSYMISFFIIAQFWLVHHRVLRTMRGHSEGLAWRNFGFLLALTLMPFSSDLVGRYGNNPLATTIFGLNLVALSLSTQWIFLYAARHGLLSDEARSMHDERTARVRAGLVIAVVALAVLLAWTDQPLSRYVWLLFLLVSPVAERITRAVERPPQPRSRANEAHAVE
jgi:TMEM175 potassium channel family protein